MPVDDNFEKPITGILKKVNGIHRRLYKIHFSIIIKSVHIASVTMPICCSAAVLDRNIGKFSLCCSLISCSGGQGVALIHAAAYKQIEVTIAIESGCTHTGTFAESGGNALLLFVKPPLPLLINRRSLLMGG